MMNSLFSVFDPVVWGCSLNWSIIFFIFILVMLGYYELGGWESLNFMKGLSNMFGVLEGVSLPYQKGLAMFSVGLLFYLMLMNLMGLNMFVFTGTAHLFMTLGVGLVLWMSCFLMGWFRNFWNSVAHLVPQGSPMVLAPALVLIESVSHLIRPFTLSVRLAANMMAGHLIIGLLSEMSELSLLVSVFSQLFLLVLEIGVAIIQGVVFSILFTLYAVEYY